MAKGPGSRHTMVLHLEPKRAATTIGCILMMLIAVAVVVAALNFPEIWPRPNPPEISDRTLSIIEAGAAFVALLFLWGAIHNGRRWRTSRAIRRLSNNPKLSSFMPQAQLPEPVVLATTIPQLDTTLDRSSRKFDHIAPTKIRVKDKFGSYPARALRFTQRHARHSDCRDCSDRVLREADVE